MDVSVTAPRGFSLSQLQVKLSLLDSSNTPVASRTLNAASDFTATLDASTLTDGTYQLQAQLLSVPPCSPTPLLPTPSSKLPPRPAPQ